MVEKFGVDPARYLAVSLIPFGPDGDISMDGLTKKYNVDLANNLGNLVSRTNKMAEKYFGGKVPQTSINDTLTTEVAKILNNGYGLSIENMQFHKTAEILQQAITIINQQIEQDAPWKLAKTDMKKLADCMYSYFQATDLIALHLIPFMPTISEKIWSLNGANGNIIEVAKKYFQDKQIPKEGFSPADNQLGKFEILFPRIEIKK